MQRRLSLHLLRILLVALPQHGDCLKHCLMGIVHVPECLLQLAERASRVHFIKLIRRQMAKAPLACLGCCSSHGIIIEG
jgi:hypothetical protein